MKNTIFLLLTTILCAPASYAAGIYENGDTLHVLAMSGLRLRDKPGGAVVATMPYGASIIMQEYQPRDRPDTVDQIPGYWSKAVWQGKEGYVFDGFLSILPAPNEQVESLSAYCDRYFLKKGEVIGVKFGDEEDTNDIGIQYYTYRNLLIELKTNGYYEGSSETLTIDPIYRVSAGEIFLLIKAIYRKDIAESLKKIEKGEFKLNTDVQPSNRSLNKSYYNFVPSKDGREVNYYLYTDGCFEGLKIGEFGNMIFVQRWGGC